MGTVGRTDPAVGTVQPTGVADEEAGGCPLVPLVGRVVLVVAILALVVGYRRRNA